MTSKSADPFNTIDRMEDDIVTVRDLAWAIDIMAGTVEDRVLGQAIRAIASGIRDRCEVIEKARGTAWHALHPNRETARKPPGQIRAADKRLQKSRAFWLPKVETGEKVVTPVPRDAQS